MSDRDKKLRNQTSPSLNPFGLKTIFYFLILWICILTGLAISGYLEFIGMALMRGELLGGALCAGDDPAFNCHALSASPYAKFFGMPLALLGVWVYFMFLVLSLFAFFKPSERAVALSAMVGLALFCLIADAYLAYTMFFVVGVACKLCLATYFLNFCILSSGLLLTFPNGGLKIFEGIGFFLSRRPSALWIGCLAATSFLGVMAVHETSKYFARGMSPQQVMEMASKLKPEDILDINLEGTPFRGAADAPIQIIKFSDFMCPACQKSSQFDSIIERAYPGKVAIYFKHFPLDKACNDSIQYGPHDGACRAAQASWCAHQQGKFWQVHDQIYKQAKFNIADLDKELEKTGVDMFKLYQCLTTPPSMDFVRRDVQHASAAGVNSTPTYIVNGVPLRGILSPQAFQELYPAFLAIKEKKDTKKVYNLK